MVEKKGMSLLFFLFVKEDEGVTMTAFRNVEVVCFLAFLDSYEERL